MNTSPIPRLLTHLAEFSSFARQGELLCTRGLALFLQDVNAKRAFLEYIHQFLNREGTDELSWLAEVRQADGGRPDLEGCTIDGSQVVKIEAKLSAQLDEGQLHSYLGDLVERCQAGVLLVLVPRRRAEEATTVVRAAAGAQGPGPWLLQRGRRGCHVGVIFWEDVVAVLRRVPSEPLRADVEQFEAMYRGLNGDVILPFHTLNELHDPEHREKLVRVVDRVTRRLTNGDRVLPMGGSSEDGEYRRRYICRALGDEHPCFSVGVRQPFMGYQTPIWLRFHSQTAKFARIAERLQRSPLAAQLVDSGGHLWMPLQVPLNVDGEEVLDVLAAKIRDIVAVAYAPLD